jgi:3-hydroxyisobutyrate dehydrogenase-like beta-hydroxyacid dehydrogenase
MKTRIGFAGLGLMGSRMAPRYLGAGYPLTVWNRTARKADPLVKAGARLATSPKALAEASDTVVVCLADPPAVEEFVFGKEGLLEGAHPGLRYVETSTLSPSLVKRVAEALRARGGDLLEAPVTGSKTGAEKGTLVIMTGGARALHEELMPVLMAIGSKAIYCGETGQASIVKLIGNLLISFMLEGFCEGLVLGEKAGVSQETLLEVVMASGYASSYFPFKGKAIAERDFATHFSIDLLVKDQTLMLEEAAARGVPMPGLAAIREVFQAARAQGFGQEDIAAVYKSIERAAGRPPS